MEKITIYTSETCPYCVQIKDAFTKEKLKFKEKDIRKNEKSWQETVSLTGLPTTPTIYYKNNYFIPQRDFGNPQMLINLLKEFKESEFSLPYRNNEAIKTLNYNVAMAFGRLDQTLRKIENKLNTEENVDKSNN